MTYSTYGPNERGPGERWSFNLPLAIGVVFVFLVGVIAWVVVSSGEETVSPASTTTSTMPPVAPSLAPPLTASPIPIPAITLVTVPPTTVTPATVPVTVTVPATNPAPPPATPAPAATTTTGTPSPPTLSPVTPTTAPGSSAGAVPGDLAVEGRPMSKPACDDKYITIIGSAVGDQANAAGFEAILEDNDGAEYLRTDQTCPSLTQASDGEPIYVVYLGPFGSDTAACQARSKGPQGAYVRQLSNSLGPDHFVNCP